MDVVRALVPAKVLDHAGPAILEAQLQAAVQGVEMPPGVHPVGVAVDQVDG